MEAQLRASTCLLTYSDPSRQQINPCAAVKRRPQCFARSESPEATCNQPVSAGGERCCLNSRIKTEREKKERNPRELKIRLNSDDPLHSSKSELNSAPHAHSCEVTAFVYYLEANRSSAEAQTHQDIPTSKRHHGGVYPHHKHGAGVCKFTAGQTVCFQTGMARIKNQTLLLQPPHLLTSTLYSSTPLYLLLRVSSWVPVMGHTARTPPAPSGSGLLLPSFFTFRLHSDISPSFTPHMCKATCDSSHQKPRRPPV